MGRPMAWCNLQLEDQELKACAEVPATLHLVFTWGPVSRVQDYGSGCRSQPTRDPTSRPSGPFAVNEEPVGLLDPDAGWSVHNGHNEAGTPSTAVGGPAVCAGRSGWLVP